MIYKPKKKTDKLDIVVFIAENFLYFLGAGLFAFVFPILYHEPSYGHRAHISSETSDALYNENSGGFSIACLAIATIFVVAIVVYKLSKYYLIAIETTDNQFILHYKNYLKNKKQKDVLINGRLFYVHSKRKAQADRKIYALAAPGEEDILLSLEDDKYWDINKSEDRETFKDLLKELVQKGARLKATNVYDSSTNTDAGYGTSDVFDWDWDWDWHD